MKSIRLTKHALEQSTERGATEQEGREAIMVGIREAAKQDRVLYRANFQYNAFWQGKTLRY